MSTAGHTIDIRPFEGRVAVSVGGIEVASSYRAVVLDETGLPARYYLPRDDVRLDLLRPTKTASTCPFKGAASYWAVEVGGDRHEDVVWSYEAPIPEAAGIAGLLAFWAERGAEVTAVES